MVDEEQDPFAFIIENCRYSSSQEELLKHAKFAREDEIFSDDDNSPEMEDSGVSHRKLDGEDDSGKRIEGEFVADVAESSKAKILGFRGERKGETSGTKLEGLCEEEREIEPELKKCKVSPLVHCSGKMGIEGEDDGEEIVMFEGDLKVEKVSSLRSGVRGSGDCAEKSSCEGGGDDVHIEGEMKTESGSKRKLEFGGNTEVIDVEEEDEDEDDMKKNPDFVVDDEVINVEEDEEEGDVGKERGGGEGSGNVEDDKRRGDGTSTSNTREEDITRRRKRELPRSLFGLVWREGGGDGNRVVGNRDVEEEQEQEVLCGEGSGDGNRVVGNRDVEEEQEVLCGEGSGDGNRVVGNRDVEEEEEILCGEGSGNANRNGMVENGHVENNLEEASVERNRDGISKGCEEETMKSLLDVLRFLVREKSVYDGGKVNFFETVKRRGLTFPQSRFLPEVEEDE